jgi:hypothetical protein
LSFKNVTQNVWNSLIATVKADTGITIPPTEYQGSLTQTGFTFVWNVNIEAATGSIQCTDSPFFVPCSAINSKIISVVTSCGAQQA